MGKITVISSISLDGVSQAPGRPDEDVRGGFVHGGWAVPYNDQVMGEAMGKGMAGNSAILLGRRTYEDLYSYWPKQNDNPYTDVLNKTRKYVASRSLSKPLPWQNSTLLEGDAVEAVARLKQEVDGDLAVIGSVELVQALALHDLVDAYVLLIHPLVLGTGRRFFAADGALAAMRLVDSTTTTTGVIIATYVPEGR